jgi:hypothetical protein
MDDDIVSRTGDAVLTLLIKPIRGDIPVAIGMDRPGGDSELGTRSHRLEVEMEGLESLPCSPSGHR